ncbi:MAG: serpin family protein [Oscillospiraceae bacterium]|nr:serpin family protein [Oscillospiraceae bacterium]
MKTNRVFASVLASMLLCSALTACGNIQTVQPAVQAADPAAEIKPQQVSGMEPDETFINAQTGFALNLLRETALAEAGKNILISPESVMQALAMTANGAANQTLSEMEQALGGIPVNTLNEYLYTQRTAIPENENCKFKMANSIWVRDDADRIKLDPAFLQKNANYYAANAFLAPFDESTRLDINNWCSERTNNMIPEMLTEPISPDTVMYLVNAVCFEAKWEKVYEEEPAPQNFHAANGTEQTAQMMYSEEHTYLSDAHATGFLKNYQGGKYAFAAILPEEGMTPEQYLADLQPEALHAMLANAEQAAVQAALPQFSYDYKNELSGVLSSMGMPSAFDVFSADFSGMTGSQNQLFINRVLHKTHIDVDTEGTKAAAVTAVEVNDECAAEMPDDLKYVILDRPFVYLIVDTETMLPVFSGVLNEIP